MGSISRQFTDFQAGKRILDVEMESKAKTVKIQVLPNGIHDADRGDFSRMSSVIATGINTNTTVHRLELHSEHFGSKKSRFEIVQNLTYPFQDYVFEIFTDRPEPVDMSITYDGAPIASILTEKPQPYSSGIFRSVRTIPTSGFFIR